MTRVWDLPFRLWHWALALSVLFSLYTGLAGDISLMEWHQRSGFVVLALLLFRVGWWIWGGRYVRLSEYRTTPRRFIQHFAGTGKADPHTSPGIVMAIFVILALTVQAGTGLFATDDIFNEGPLVRHVGGEVSATMTWIHHRVFWVIIALVATHITANAVYAMMRDPTPLAIFTGRKPLDLPPTEQHLLRALFTAAGAALVVYGALAWSGY
ncbi:MAG: cytochrome b/b6 domain-containing protein [Gammaproteobacteria bacterium]|nr:cytochrome b/b6 domain-containing protein [Gammaproteobacteria bacterium]